MNQKFYVASCVFTEEYPALSKKICEYMRGRVPIIRCCVDKYKVAEFEERMPENYREAWRAIKHFEKYPAGSVMISLCHNCAAIFEERHPEIKRESLWEYILADKSFKYRDFGGEAITIQDCWRQKENFAEQEAVRELLRLLTLSTATQSKIGSAQIFTRGARIISRTHARTKKIAHGRALQTNSDGKSDCVLPLLHSRIKIGRQKGFSLSRTFIRGR